MTRTASEMTRAATAARISKSQEKCAAPFRNSFYSDPRNGSVGALARYRCPVSEARIVLRGSRWLVRNFEMSFALNSLQRITISTETSYKTHRYVASLILLTLPRLDRSILERLPRCFRPLSQLSAQVERLRSENARLKKELEEARKQVLSSVLTC